MGILLRLGICFVDSFVFVFYIVLLLSSYLIKFCFCLDWWLELDYDGILYSFEVFLLVICIEFFVIW